MLHASYSQSELKIIADAVQEHNVDFKYKDECIDSINNTEQAQKEAYKQNRFQGSSIYSMIIADADKDNFINETAKNRLRKNCYQKFLKKFSIVRQTAKMC